MKLSTQAVTDIFMDCLFKDGELIDNSKPYGEYIEVEGLHNKFGFNPESVERNKTKILELLEQLPLPFRHREGGGWSFLQACMNKDNEQWTSLHKTMDELFCLGMAIGVVEYLLPDRDLWKVMPGGMPYLVIKYDFNIN